ncbi:hypothetical protein G4D82_05565 [Flavobacterium sp. CYK-4]|uniref:hypothetical protein n=1 Tax=Flavobacterium lotistagni TaxID=2709660 RepID=UPI00140CE631|nr:hypothetical protein [Flavobacterium lotistagni]NHM06680.1 hypothetical protein [Flavobacterium lotistagni]
MMLHVGNYATIPVKAFDENGNAISVALTWSTSDSTVAIVSNGTVTAIGIGSCEISFTDNVHSVRSINVDVVANSTLISNSASQIDLGITGNMLFLNTDATEPFSFKLYNDSGQIVNNNAVTLEFPNGSGLTWNGTNIMTSSQTGVFVIRFRVGDIYLPQVLQVFVNNPTASITSDTIYAFSVIPSTFPSRFYKAGSAGRPILINACKAYYVPNNTFPVSKSYVTVPDIIELSGGGEISVDGNGVISANSSTLVSTAYPIDRKITFYYKDAPWQKIPLVVGRDASGNYGKTFDQENSYNFCVTQQGPTVRYGIYAEEFEGSNCCYNGWFGSYGYLGTVPLRGTSRIIRNGQVVTNESPFDTMLNSVGPFNSLEGNGVYWSYFGLMLGGEQYNLNYLEDGKVEIAQTNTLMVKGQGDCAAQEIPVTGTLFDVLKGHTWSLSNCFSNFEQYSSPITLNANGTWSVPGSLYIGETWLPGEGPTTWTTSGNDYIILTYNARPDDVSPVELMEEIFPVSSFTATQITMPAAPESGCGTYIYD